MAGRGQDWPHHALFSGVHLGNVGHTMLLLHVLFKLGHLLHTANTAGGLHDRGVADTSHLSLHNRAVLWGYSLNLGEGGDEELNDGDRGMQELVRIRIHPRISHTKPVPASAHAPLCSHEGCGHCCCCCQVYTPPGSGYPDPPSLSLGGRTGPPGLQQLPGKKQS